MLTRPTRATRLPSTPLRALFLGLLALSVACSDTDGDGKGGTSTADAAADVSVFDAGGSAPDTATADSAAPDTTEPDTNPADTAQADAAAPDTKTPDTSAPDTSTPDTAVADTAVADTSTPDTTAADTTSADTGTADTGAADTSSPDTSNPDTTTADTGSQPPLGTFKALSCKKFVNKNTDGTVNPFIAPARNGQFYVSWVQKGGNLMLNWESPDKCTTEQGPLQVNKTKGDVYYWGGIGVVSDTAGDFYAVWESKAKGADISLAWSLSGLSFNAPIEVVSTSTNGQDPALWVKKPGELYAAWRGHHPSKKQYDPYVSSAKELFKNKSLSKGVSVYEDATQDDQVAIAANSKGHLFVAVQSYAGDIFVSRSTDGGKTWGKRVQVNDVTGKANVGKASFMVVTPDDRVVVMWSDTRKKKSGNENDVFADSSADGLTWGKDVQVNDNDARYQQDPSMAVATAGACKGAIYAVWQDFRGKKSYDIYMAKSVDGGKTWSKNEPVAIDKAEDEMNPAIAVDGGCTIGVAWRDSTKNSSFDIGLAYFTW